MDYLKALLDTYELCEREDLVDKTEQSLYILPIYHSSMTAKSNNIVNIVLDRAGKIKTADFLADGETIVFPVTEDSGTRSSNPAAHPLVDKFKYLNQKEDTRQSQNYIEELENWLEYSRKNEEIPILEAVHSFVTKNDIFKNILEKLFPIKEIEFHDNYEFTHYYKEEDKEKKKKYKFNEVFITFELDNENKLISVSKNSELHKSYINYVNYLNSSKEKKVCNVANKKMYSNNKHRGIVGNAKIISVSNNKETYYGRFRNESDVFNIGYESSQKIHLMLKALMENENSYTFLGESQHMVIWSSDDISNKEQISLTDPGRSKRGIIKDNQFRPVTEAGGEVGKSIRMGRKLSNPNAKFYILIMDNLNPGRVAVKYFRELPKSELLARLETWVANNSWDSYSSKDEKWIYKAPNIYQIIDAAYGIERDGKLQVQNKKLRANLIQEMIQCIVDGKAMPSDILLSLRTNIINRHKYEDTWNQVYYTALAVLRNYLKVQGGVKEVMDKVKDSRSFLFGRLLAVYEGIESANYGKDSDQRATNAEKYWSAYITNPEVTMLTIDQSVIPYSNRLKRDNPGLYHYYESKKAEIMSELEANDYFSDKLNSQLDFRFIYGYYYQKQINYSKKEKEEVRDDAS